jgi:large subunit ribosomal protein L9
VTPHQVAEALEDQLGESVDHRRVHLAEPIRSVGVHEIQIHLHPEVDATITVDVVSR